MKTFVLMMVSLLFAISSEAQNKSFYDFTVKTIDGKDFPLSSLKGKKVLVVNVASKCGLTPQYAQLEKLYEKYKEKDVSTHCMAVPFSFLSRGYRESLHQKNYYSLLLLIGNSDI